MDDVPLLYVRVRLAVAWLGQDGNAGWWKSSFLSTSGLAFSGYNFQRAPRLAAYSASCAAAKRVHDDRIGRSRTLHLFRLRLDDEVRTHRAAAGAADHLLPAASTNSAGMMQVLEEIAGEMIDAPAGPVQVGSTRDAFSVEGLREVAKHYLSGFRHQAECFPFFAGGAV